MSATMLFTYYVIFKLHYFLLAFFNNTLVSFYKYIHKSTRTKKTNQKQNQTNRSKMSTPLRRYNSFSSPRQNQERDQVPSLRDLPKSRFATRPCVSVIQPRRPRPLVFSHIEVYKMVESIATELREAGVRPKTACAYVLPNSLEAVVYFLALQWIGAVAIPIDPNLEQSLLSSMLTAVSALTVVSPFVDEEDRGDDELYKKVSKVCENGNHVHWLIARSMNKGVYLEMCGRRAGQQSAWAGGAGDFRFEPTDTAFKLPSVHPVAQLAVQISHGTATEISKLFVDAYNLSERHSTLLMLPLYSIHGLMSVLVSLTCGGNIVIADTQTLNAETIVKHISTMNLNWLNADTMTLMSLFESVYKYTTDSSSSPLSTLQFVRCIGGTISEEILEKVLPLISGPVLHSYGTTDTCGLITTNKTDQMKVRSFGKPVGDIEVQIFDENTRQLLSPNSDGLIGVYGGHIAVSAETNDGVINMCFAKENDKMFFLTGDKGSIDDDGFLKIQTFTSNDSDSKTLIEMLEKKMKEYEQQKEEEKRRLEAKKEQEEAASLHEQKLAEEKAEELRKAEEEERVRQEKLVQDEEEKKITTLKLEQDKMEEESNKNDEEEAKQASEEDNIIGDSETSSSATSCRSSSSSSKSSDIMERRMGSSSSDQGVEERVWVEEKAEDDAQVDDKLLTKGSSSSKSGSVNITSDVFVTAESNNKSKEEMAEAPEMIEHEEQFKTKTPSSSSSSNSELPAREVENVKATDEEPYLLRDLMYRMSKMEHRIHELEEELSESKKMNNITYRLEALEEKMRSVNENKEATNMNDSQHELTNTDADNDGDNEMEGSDNSSSKLHEEEDGSELKKELTGQTDASSAGTQTSKSDTVVINTTNSKSDLDGGIFQTSQSELNDEGNATSKSDMNNEEHDTGKDENTSADIEEVEQASKSASLSASVSIDVKGSGTSSSDNIVSTSTSGEDSSIGINSSNLVSGESADSNKTVEVSGTSKDIVSTTSGTSTGESSSGSDSDAIESVEDSTTIASRIEALEEAVAKLVDNSADDDYSEAMISRLTSIEENQKRLDEEMEKGHRAEMENLHTLVQDIESTHAKQTAAYQKCASSLAAVQRAQPKQIPPSVDVEELARAVRQAAASAAKSSRDTTAAAAAAREAAAAAKSASDAHAALLKKPSGDGSDGTLKKTAIIPLEEVEHAICTHPSVEVARVFGRPDRKFGREIYCVVKLKEGARISEPWIKLHAQVALPPAYVPKKFFVKQDLTGDEDRVALSKVRGLTNVAKVDGHSKTRVVRSPAWSPVFKKSD